MIMRWLGGLATKLGLTPPLQTASLEQLFAAMEERARPCVRLIQAEADIPVSTKLGGLPEMMGRYEWPCWKGRPLSFVAQIELPEIRLASGLDWLPDEGRLFFFYDLEQEAWGFDPEDKGAWIVLYDASPDPASHLDAPSSLPEHGRFPERSMAAVAARSYPSPDRLRESVGVPADEDWDAAYERHRLQSPAHQLGGYPAAIQYDGMERECQFASNGIYLGDGTGYETPQALALEAGAEDWLLLLQVDSYNDESGMMWGDCGMLYFWIRRQDVAGRDFSKVWMVLQCS